MVFLRPVSESEVSSSTDEHGGRCEDAINGNRLLVARESSSSVQLGVECEEHFTHSHVRERLVDFTVSDIAVGVEYHDDLLTVLYPGSQLFLDVVQKGLPRAAVVILIIKIVHVLTVGT